MSIATRSLCVCILLISGFAWRSNAVRGEGFTAKAVKIDITPTEPVRLSGYGNRDRPSERVDTPLFVRCLALFDEDQTPHLLFSVDTIGLDGSLTNEVASAIADRHGLSRAQIVFCSTHSHTTPQLASGLDNIFTVPMSEAEQAASQRYTQRLKEALLQAATDSLRDPLPATVEAGQTSVDFAANRRLVRDGRYAGFGVQTEGPVDHSLPFLVVRDEAGSILAIAYNYACHCTTLTGDDYGVSGDWAGVASSKLEALYPGCVALCTIGCGADQNPEPRGNLALARQHGETLAGRLVEAVSGQLTRLEPRITAGFDFAALPFELPTIEELERNKTAADAQTRRLAERLSDTYRREGRLPATYPVPVQAWKIGQRQMIFLGGEVVVDYALRLKRELDDDQLWVTAYANDVLGYIASDRLRREGGYEVDRSAVFYGLPGPWADGVEELLIDAAISLTKRDRTAGPLEPADAIKSFDHLEDFELELVAAEPLIADPINIAFGPDGRLWVVEMGDYPNGSTGPAATNSPLPESMRGGGRIKALFDDDGDGRMDRAEVFLDGVDFATGVHPWRDGLIVAAAPWVFFAADRDGDGRCDEVRPLIEGLKLSNPQHRINGFAYGLDHSLHLAAGDDLGEVVVSRTGQSLNAAGSDLQLWPDRGEVRAVPGRSQFIRSRDDWGNWFGSDNSRPLYHYVLDGVTAGDSAAGLDLSPQQAFDPPIAPPVYPLSESDERFNDLFAADRFTSACSATIVRSDALGDRFRGGVAVCEPVHNLVHYSQLIESGSSFLSQRPAEFRESELLRSTDPWFRPVRIVDGPDDALWVVDMYRRVIEHPEWIPAAWQQQLDLRAGEKRGRIYRLRRVSETMAIDDRWKRIDSTTNDGLLTLLCSSNGTLRDMAQQELLHRELPPDIGDVRSLLAGKGPHATIHALAILQSMGEVDTTDLSRVLSNEHPGVLQYTLQTVAATDDLRVRTRVRDLAQHDSPAVAMRAILATTRFEHPELGRQLIAAAHRNDVDRWMDAALIIAAHRHGAAMMQSLLSADAAAISSVDKRPLPPPLFAAMCDHWRSAGDPIDRDWLAKIEGLPEGETLVAALLKVDRESAFKTEPPGLLEEVRRKNVELHAAALEDASIETEAKLEAIQAVRDIASDAPRLTQTLTGLLGPTQPIEVQIAAIGALRQVQGDAFFETVLAKWSQVPPLVRVECITAAAARRNTSSGLLDAIEGGMIAAADVPPTVSFQLRSAGPRSNQVRAQRIFGDGSAGRDADVLRHLAAMPPSGDVDRGRELFGKHCAACHTPDERGRIVGPPLSNLSNYGDEALVVSILDPNRAVDPKYHARIVRTMDGEVLTGVVDEETAEGFTIVAADGKRFSLSRSEVEESKQTGVSLMPSNFAEALSAEDLRHVIDHLKRSASR